ncbi:hypothetical protein ACLMJK_007575 [Lecanora helva]
MAYSLSPLAAAGSSQVTRHLQSPTLPQPINKQKKKKDVMEERFAQISQDFNENRDLHFRKQMQNFQIDIDYIRQADLYASKTLDGLLDDGSLSATGSTAASTQGSIRNVQMNGSNWFNNPMRIGIHADKFATDINDAMEQRDAELTTISYRHNFRIDELQRDYEFNVMVAEEEHGRLLESLRQRLIQSLNQKKATIQKEREKLESADTNYPLLHPSQFNLNNGASPGGPQSNRKTRHTRHRLEVDDVEATNGGNKRKRKAPADTDNGSPAPAGRELEATNAYKETNLKWEQPQAPPPLYSLDALFSQRELDANLQLTTFEIIEDMKRRKLSKDSNVNLGSVDIMNADGSDSEDNVEADTAMFGAAEESLLQAPEMERSATNASQHVTRSTRGLIPKRASGPEGLGSLAGRAAGVSVIGTAGYASAKDKKKDDEYQRAPPLTELEVEDDMAMMKAAMEEEDEGRANTILLEDPIEERENHVGTGSVDGEVEEPRHEDG